MDECPICLETCHEDFQSSCCKKSFHKNCYEKCLNINNTCPTCRTVFVKVEHEVEIKINCCTWRIICFCCIFCVKVHYMHKLVIVNILSVPITHTELFSVCIMKLLTWWAEVHAFIMAD
jgi:hypothetical protein